MSWLHSNLNDNMCFRGLVWRNVFPYLCHELWKDQNDYVFKNALPSSTTTIITRACFLAKDFPRAANKSLDAYASICIGLPFSHSNVNTFHVEASLVSVSDQAGLGGMVIDSGGYW